MPYLDKYVGPKDYKQGLHEGAGKSLTLSIGALKKYRESGTIPNVGENSGLRKTYNDLLAQALDEAKHRGAAEERERLLALLVVVPFRRAR